MDGRCSRGLEETSTRTAADAFGVKDTGATRMHPVMQRNLVGAIAGPYHFLVAFFRLDDVSAVARLRLV